MKKKTQVMKQFLTVSVIGLLLSANRQKKKHKSRLSVVNNAGLRKKPKLKLRRKKMQQKRN